MMQLYAYAADVDMLFGLRYLHLACAAFMCETDQVRWQMLGFGNTTYLAI